MKKGSKYYPLFAYLQGCDQPAVALTLSAIESLLQAPLPASARTRKAWWSNRDSAGALQAGAWVQAGYHVKTIDFEQELVTFQRFQAQYLLQEEGGALVWNQDAIKALRKHMSLTQAQFAEQLGVRRQTISEWENGVYAPDRSTAKHLQLVAEKMDFGPWVRARSTDTGSTDTGSTDTGSTDTGS